MSTTEVSAVDTAGPALQWRVAVAMGLVILFWASAFVGIRDVAPFVEPGPMALGRLLVAALPLALFAWRRGFTLPRGRTAVMVALYGALWFAGYTVVLNAAEHQVDAGTAAMIVNVAPLIVAVLAGVLLGEGFPRQLVIGLAVGLCGVALIGLGGAGRHASTTGLLLALLSALLYALGVLTQKVALRRIDPLSATVAGVGVGIVVLLPFLPSLVRDVSAAPASAVGWVVYLGLVPTALGFLLWAFVLSHATAGQTASATLAVPAVAVLMSWLVLAEVPTVWALVGGALALLGVAVSRRRTAAVPQRSAPVG